jgi:translation initiation factor IF-2
MSINRLSKVAKELGVGVSTIVEFLQEKGYEVEARPTTKIGNDEYNLLLDEFQSDKKARERSNELKQNKLVRETISLDDKDVIDNRRRKSEDEESILIKNVPVAESIDLGLKAKEEAAAAEAAEAEAAEKAPAEPEKTEAKKPEVKKPVVLDKIDLSTIDPKGRKKEAKAEEPVKQEEEKKEEAPKPAEEKPAAKSDAPEHIETKVEKLSGPTVLGKIEVKEEPKRKPVASSNDDVEARRKRRKRINRGDGPAQGEGQGRGRGRGQKQDKQVELSEEEIQQQVRETLARLSGGGKSKSAKHRRAKREAISQQMQEEELQKELEKKVLKVTEFVTASELANLMDVAVNDVLSACMSLGLFVSINQRLDAETLTVVAEEFGFTVEFTTEEIDEKSMEEDDDEKRLTARPPIVTVMGHVDHGKTSLLDHIRKANVIAGEAGGITQHIGAYSVHLDDGREITFLDTPGHEAFTAMRSRGAQITDVVIVVIAADDNVMPQTKEAINHAQAAGVPIVFAINKIDKDGANPDRIKEELAGMNLLVEEWGGKYQSQDVSAKNGLNVDELLDKVLLEAELLELKADPGKRATGTVIEASLDKGKGYVATVIVSGGTLTVGDMMLAGSHFGKVKALQNERGQNVDTVGPGKPVTILGLNGAPSAGDKFFIFEDEREAKNIATKRAQLQREQGVRATKHITLDEIGRRIAIGDFQELNIILKGDVDGSIEALSDSLLNLTTEKIQVNIIHKSVGQISESDVLLASASDAIIIGFQVRPSANARKLAEKEEIDIRLYSVIYQAIEEVKDAMEGMLKPTVEEQVVCNVEVRETFKISKVGTIAGCFVTDGTITRNTKIRLIREGIVVYTGELGSLKRFKDDVKEVKKGFECGLNIANFNDIKVGDVIEGYEEVEVKQTL